MTLEISLTHQLFSYPRGSLLGQFSVNDKDAGLKTETTKRRQHDCGAKEPVFNIADVTHNDQSGFGQGQGEY